MNAAPDDYDDAIWQLQAALKRTPRMGEERKALLYSLGELHEKMGEREAAITQFKIIYEADIHYRDVTAKVDAYWEAKS
ncbi:MAG: Tetratricopeptide domain protein [Verrucomicrobia bacterium]|jgi:hypothetical protein|nr:Tetratricopeptide domain protein [Verrucomicrobiota bacterium]